MQSSASLAKGRIQGAVLALSADSSTIFSRSVSKFVLCTEESRERCPAVVMRNMRQFMSGMKNYLLRSREGEAVVAVIDAERAEVNK